MATLSTATASPVVRALSPAATAALRDVWPILLTLFPFAVAIGAAIAAAPISGLAGWSGGPLVWAGSAHLAAVTLLGAGASWITVVTTGLAINARFAVYGAALSPYFQAQPRWFRWIAPHFIVDQMFALVLARPAEERDDPRWFRTYYLTVALLIGAVWMPSIAAGILAGPVIPESWPVEFAAPAALAGLLAPGLKTRSAVVAAIVGAAGSLALEDIAGSYAVILAAVLGMAAGTVVTRVGDHRGTRESEGSR